jgi:DNA-binding CsgD family transcriptional regulator
MRIGAVDRRVESEAIAAVLASALGGPAGLIIEGEAGIGKTTTWFAAVDAARAQGFQVLTARSSQAESTLAYTAVADLLGDLDAPVVDGLPDVQRLALSRVLLGADTDGPETDQRVVGAAMVTVLERLAADAPVLLAVDDVQWLDSSSRAVLAFVLRRVTGRLAAVLTQRTEPDVNAASDVEMGRPEAVSRVRVTALDLAGVHAVVAQRLGRTFPRPTIARIAELSGGNPFYALELARTIGEQRLDPAAVLPATLAEVVRARVAHFDDDAREILLASACLGSATVEAIAQAVHMGTEPVVRVLDDAQTDGVITMDGHRVRFTHPLLAQGVYTDATAAQRRAMHARCAAIVEHPELHARHLALATVGEDPATLQALDDAANAARSRGAMAAAAELVDLAISRGGDTPARRLRSATHHLRAGDAERARAVLDAAIEGFPSGRLRARALNLLAGMHIYSDGFGEVVTLLQRALHDASGDPIVRVQTLPMLSYVHGNLDQSDQALHHAKEAVTEAEALGVPVLTSAALAVKVLMQLWFGHGIDEPSLARALALEDLDVNIPIPFRPSAVNAMALAMTGRLDQASVQMQAVWQRCLERGAENDVVWVAGHATLIELWRGRLDEAARMAQEAVQRAEQIGGDQVLMLGLIARVAVAAYQGDEHIVRRDARAAIEHAQRCGSADRLRWPNMSLGFLELSLGNYAAAMAAFDPLLSACDRIPGAEIITNSYVPDAIEAMVMLDRLDEAEPLIADLETNGSRLDRAWMLAAGARCRSMWLAAHGDVTAAETAAREAMSHHDRLPMPFERARTELLLGQLQRRRRQKEAAADTMSTALRAVERMGATLWADRARRELARINVAAGTDVDLTPSERQVAELAASGMTNRDVAAALFISVKTVEANLGRIYRKLGIRSRAELGRRMDRLAVAEQR